MQNSHQRRIDRLYAEEGKLRLEAIAIGCNGLPEFGINAATSPKLVQLVLRERCIKRRIGFVMDPRDGCAGVTQCDCHIGDHVPGIAWALSNVACRGWQGLQQRCATTKHGKSDARRC
jgi:hypothetical protein